MKSAWAHGTTALVAAALQLAAPRAWAQAQPWSLEEFQSLTCDRAVERMNAGMRDGRPEAFRVAGVLMEKGVCFKTDMKRAASYYQQAADRGDRSGRLHLALLFASGMGAPQDYATAGALVRHSKLETGYVPTREDYTVGYSFLLSRVAGTALAAGPGVRVSKASVIYRINPSGDEVDVVLDVPIGPDGRLVRTTTTAMFREAFANAKAVMPTPDPALLVKDQFSIDYVFDCPVTDGDRFEALLRF